MTDTYRILVTGSREWADPMAIALELAKVVGFAQGRGRKVVIVHGACPRGADAMADDIARSDGIEVEPHPAGWKQFGKAAGFRRNAEMVALGADICLAFIKDGSKGATHTADLAEKAGIPVRRFTA